MVRPLIWLLVVLALAGAAPLRAQEAPEGFRDAEETFNNKLSLTSRLAFRNAMIAAGYLNGVPTERFSLRLFRGIQKLQREHGLAPDGQLGKAVVERAFALAFPMFRMWDLRRVAHPDRGHSILVPTGMGLERISNDRGIAYSHPDGRLLVRFNHFAGTDALTNYNELVSKYERNNVKINFKLYKEGWFVISTTSNAGVDGYIRYHDDVGGITGFVIFWNNSKGDTSADRVATLMSASLHARMTGVPFLDPPSAQPQEVASAPPAGPTPVQPSPPQISAQPRVEPVKISTGSGFFVSGDGLFVTNAHVIETCGSIAVQTLDKRVRPARLMARDGTNDLALLKVEVAPTRHAKLRASARLGEDVAAFGFPHSDLFASTGNFTLGNITATAGLNDDTRFFQISAPVQSGNSGGPLLDERGNVIGVVTSKLNAIKFATRNGDIPQNVNFAVKASLLSGFLESSGFVPSAVVETVRLDKPDLAELGRQISGFVACQ